MQNITFKRGLIIVALCVSGASAAYAAAKIDHEQKPAEKSGQSANEQQRPADVRPAAPTPAGGIAPPGIEEREKSTKYRYQCDPSPTREDADACSQRESAESAKGQFWAAIMAAVVGAFAAVFTWRAARAAADAAEASKDSAKIAEKALNSSEPPFLIAEVEFFRPKLIGRYFEVMSGEIIEYKIKNIGRTPAIIYDVFANIAPADSMPWPSENLVIEHFPTDKIEIVANGECTTGKTITYTDEMVITYYRGKLDSEKYTWFFVGQIKYGDVFGNTYVGGFCQAFIPSERRFHGTGGPDRNYRRMIDK